MMARKIGNQTLVQRSSRSSSLVQSWWIWELGIKASIAETCDTGDDARRRPTSTVPAAAEKQQRSSREAARSAECRRCWQVKGEKRWLIQGRKRQSHKCWPGCLVTTLQPRHKQMANPGHMLHGPCHYRKSGPGQKVRCANSAQSGDLSKDPCTVWSNGAL
jgi:hypothetical protein